MPKTVLPTLKGSNYSPPSWSFYISARATLNEETMGSGNLLPSPLWGRGFASGALISRGGPGEGVETVSSPHPYRKTRSLARTTGRTDKARELRRSSTEAEQAAWHLLRKLGLKGFRFRGQQTAVGPYIAGFCCRERRLIVELYGATLIVAPPLRAASGVSTFATTATVVKGDRV